MCGHKRDRDDVFVRVLDGLLDVDNIDRDVSLHEHYDVGCAIGQGPTQRCGGR